MKVIKRDGTKEFYSAVKVANAISSVIKNSEDVNYIANQVTDEIRSRTFISNTDEINIETVQDIVENKLFSLYPDKAKEYIKHREKRNRIREMVKSKISFIERYKRSDNTANATIDDNANVSSMNVAVLNSEIHKEDNIEVNRGMIMSKLKELYPDINPKIYLQDLNSHIIYKNDESSFCGVLAPYCASISMYPFLKNGLREIGGLSAAPKSLDSYCGMLINLIFAVSSQFAGAVAVGEALLYFDYFARKKWGDEYYKSECNLKEIDQKFQQIIYSINQPAGARGGQSAFTNFSIFDRPFFDVMFGNFSFPDGSKPKWTSFCFLQKFFMQWLNNERLKCILTFPVVSVSLLYKDSEFVDQDMARFVAKQYSNGDSFFTYISDSVDSLSSCCRLKNKLTTREFNFTNGNLGIQTGSKSVITLNLSRIIQDWTKSTGLDTTFESWKQNLEQYLCDILQRVYMYHNAYNELLKDVYNADLLPVYKAGFIRLNNQYLTIGINGLNQAAEYLGLQCNNNEDYKEFCQTIFSIISNFNKLHRSKDIMLNTEIIPAESLAVKNYNWDKADGYWTPDDTNLYASYVFKPNDPEISIFDKIILHGREFIGDYIDGGSACHINLDEHLSEDQYMKILHFAAENGCQYFTFNVPNSECQSCGHIAKTHFDKCPICESEDIVDYDRIIGYIKPITSWSNSRRTEQKTRVYTKKSKADEQI